MFESTGALAGFLGPTTTAPLRLVCISPHDSVQVYTAPRIFNGPRRSRLEAFGGHGPALPARGAAAG